MWGDSIRPKWMWTAGHLNSSLRNIALTAPYMHDEARRPLRDVVDYYVGGGVLNRTWYLMEWETLHLSEQEKIDLVAFLVL